MRHLALIIRNFSKSVGTGEEWMKNWAHLSLPEHGTAPQLFQKGFMSCRLNRSVTDQFGQLGNELSFCQPVFEILPKGNAMFSTRLFQTGECVSAASTGLASCSPAYLSPSYVFSDVVFAQVIMQGDFGMLEHQQELRLIVIDSLQGVV